MNRIRSFDSDKAILYLVATPIGNLLDMTYRAVAILKEVDKIYAEDTRNSIVLLKHYEINTKLESYHEFNQEIKTDSIIEELKSGMKIAIISDAGLPVISDPGYRIAMEAIKNDIEVQRILEVEHRLCTIEKSIKMSKTIEIISTKVTKTLTLFPLSFVAYMYILTSNEIIINYINRG